MIRLGITYGGVEHDYTRWLDFSKVSVTEQINVPGQMTFTLMGHGGQFVAPPVRAYVRLYSTKTKRSLFTGFIAAAPNISFLGMSTGSAQPYSQMLQYDYISSSDEYLINIKSVPFIPAFVNQTQGAILKQLANTLCPGYFDVSQVQDGDLVAYFAYDPTQSWSQIAKSFGDPSRYRYHARDKQLVYAPYGDYLLGISYDETRAQGTFAPAGLKTTVLSVPVVNDVTIVGAAEAGNNREDYFIGDGFTTNFPLLHQVFQGASTVLLQDDWTNTSLNTQNWFANDPGDQFDYSAGALNVTSGFALELGMAYIAANNGIELAGGIDLEHGEVVFNDYCTGLIGAVYNNDIFGASGIICAFQISSPDGVILSASGASGVVMQPMWGSSGVGPPVVSRFNHSYVLQTIITAPAYTRWTQAYRTVAGDEYGQAETELNGNVTFVIQDTDIAAATGVFYEPLVQKTTINNVPLPAFAAYALINNIELNLQLNFSLIAQLPRQNLYCNVGPCGLFVPTGVILPMLPPGSGGFSGGVQPWPDAASGNIFFPPAGLQGWVQEVMGNGFENQAAQITSGQATDELSFYIQTCPAAGTPIRLQSFESQAATSRLRATGSIIAEAWSAGDDGLRSAVVSNLSPLPRTSEDCDNAALAFLTDRDGIFYNGSYTCTSLFLDQSTSDIQYYPTCGRYININAPARGLNNQESLVTAVSMTLLDPVTEVIQFAIQFGADLNLEKTLNNFVDLIQPSVLTNQDKANAPNPRYSVQIGNAQQLASGADYLPDLSNVQAFWITDNYVFIAVTDDYTGNIEVRQFDANFGLGDTASGWLGTYYVQGGPTGTYIPQFADQDNVDELLANLNNTVPISYGGGPDQINPEGYNSSFSSAIGNLYSGGREVPPIPPSGGVPSGPSPNGFILSRQQYDQVWYMRPVASGQSSRRSKVIRVRYPRTPAPPNVISVTSNFIQFDFDGDVRSIYGIEISVPHIAYFTHVIFGGHVITIPVYGPDAIIVQKPVESYADLNIDLTQTPNSFITFQNRVFKARFFNHQWSYSTTTEVTVQPPAPPVLDVGYRFGQSLDILSNLDTRIDIAAQRFQVYGPPVASGSIESGQLLIDTQLNTQTANWTINVPFTGDLYVQSYRADLIGSGGWSSPLHVPQGNFFASDYLAAQGSAPPVVTSGSGSIFIYRSFDDIINVYVLPFEVIYPNGELVDVLPVSGTYGSTLDTLSPLLNGSGYLFYFSMQSAAFNNPLVFIDGPYQDPSTTALVRQQSDGNLPLTNGALTFYCSSAPSGGGAGGGGGGSGGGGGTCGVGSAMIELADGSLVRLDELQTGVKVRSLDGPETLLRKHMFKDIESWTVTTETGRKTRVGIAHTFKTESGGFITLFELLDLFKFDRAVPKVCTVAGYEKITMIADGAAESVYLLRLEGPSHIYVLDGFYNHNGIIKHTT